MSKGKKGGKMFGSSSETAHTGLGEWGSLGRQVSEKQKLESGCMAGCPHDTYLSKVEDDLRMSVRWGY